MSTNLGTNMRSVYGALIKDIPYPAMIPGIAQTAFRHSGRARRASRHCTPTSRLLGVEADWTKEANVMMKGCSCWDCNGVDSDLIQGDREYWIDANIKVQRRTREER